jgi:hypothetical protein
MDPAHKARQQAELDERIVPLVKHQPGFVSGVWSYDVAGGRSVAVLVFETERAARGMAEFVRQQMSTPNDVGVRLDSLMVAEVTAQVSR